MFQNSPNMMRPRATIAPMITFAALLIAIPVLGQQSDAELRRENQMLKARVAELEAELEAARERIASLQEELEAVRRARGPGGSSATTGTPDEVKVSVDESKPDASPRALLNALQKSHTESLGDLEHGTSDSQQRELYMRELNRWRSRVTRAFRLPIHWRVRIVQVEDQRDGQFFVTMQAIDPKFGSKLGHPFPVVISANKTRKVESLDATYSLRGTLIPEINVNSERETSGPFDRPVLIGPFAEFTFRVNANSLVPAPEPGEEEDDGGASGKTSYE